MEVDGIDFSGFTQDRLVIALYPGAVCIIPVGAGDNGAPGAVSDIWAGDNVAPGAVSDIWAGDNEPYSQVLYV